MTSIGDFDTSLHRAVSSGPALPETCPLSVNSSESETSHGESQTGTPSSISSSASEMSRDENQTVPGFSKTSLEDRHVVETRDVREDD